MYCKKCGCDITGDMKYCPFCGNENGLAKRIALESGLSGKITGIYREKMNFETGSVTNAADPVNNRTSGTGKTVSEAELERRQKNFGIASSVLLVILPFLSWVRFLGGYGGSYSLVKLYDTPVRNLYWLNDGVLIFQMFMVLLSVASWLMVILCIIYIFFWLTNSRDLKKIGKWASAVSGFVCDTFLIVMMFAKLVLAVSADVDLSGVFQIKWPAFVAFIIGILFRAAYSAGVKKPVRTGSNHINPVQSVSDNKNNI